MKRVIVVLVAAACIWLVGSPQHPTNAASAISPGAAGDPNAALKQPMVFTAGTGQPGQITMTVIFTPTGQAGH